MAPISGQERKKMAEKEDDKYALLRSPQLRPGPSRDWWDDFSRRITGPLSGENNSATFESMFQFSRRTFNYICSLVEEEMLAKPNFTDFSGKALSLNDRVAIALRRLSSGESLAAVGASVGVHQSTVSHVTWWFIGAMEKRGQHHLQWPSTEEEMRQIKSKFEEIRGLPNCCGAIDTTNIKFCLSSDDPSNEIWYDREKNASMILQAIVDPDMRFLDILAGWPGSLSDYHVLQSSTFFKLCEEGKRLNGEKVKLSEKVELREYIVGDIEFPLLPWLLTPYRGRCLSETKDDFNKRHHETLKVAKWALARLKESWRVIRGVMWRPDKHKLPRMILVCCLLHNIMIDLNDSQQNELKDSYHHPGYQQQRNGVTDTTPAAQRENLARYLSAKLPP